MNYLRDALAPVPQSEPLEPDQIRNSAGGHVWEADAETRLRRFLILGTEGGSFYTSERELTAAAIRNLRELVKRDGRAVVATAVDVSERGLAPKNDPAILAIALASVIGDKPARLAAFTAIRKVCRTSTHLFRFMEFRDALGGWGRGPRAGVARWYEERDPDALAYQLVKYRQRDGWTHRDVLRLVHPEAPSRKHRDLYDFACGRRPEAYPPVIEGFLKVQEAGYASQAAKIIRDFGLPREAVPPELLGSPEVWEALLGSMPPVALIRNIATMTRVGLLTGTADATQSVVHALGDAPWLHKARVHPIQVLAALVTYSAGHGVRGSGEWVPVPQIVDALDAAFYTCFDAVEPTGKRTLLALDVSGSMATHDCAGIPGLTTRAGSAAMALVTANVEDRYEAIAFAGPYREQRGLGVGYPHADVLEGPAAFPLSSRERLDDVVERALLTPFGPTDCAVPMIWAEREEREVDTFIIYTDNETWAGSVHPAEALRSYRRASGIQDARLIVVGMVGNDFTIADPADPGMLDVVGFDSSAPAMMSAFARGEF